MRTVEVEFVLEMTFHRVNHEKWFLSGFPLWPLFFFVGAMVMKMVLFSCGNIESYFLWPVEALCGSPL